MRPWHQPWSVEHAAGRITRPLRANGVPYRGINVLMLWGEAVASGYAAPIWMTFRQAQEIGGHVRKGERGSLVVYASTLTRTEDDAETGEELERSIPFMKGYTVFNVEQIEGLPAHYYAKPRRRAIPSSASPMPKPSWTRPAPTSATAAARPPTTSAPTACACRRSRRSRTPKAITQR